MATKGVGDVKSVYFAGSIRGGRDDASLYYEIIKMLQALHVEVLTEHVGLDDLTADGEQHKTTREIYERDMAWLRSADAVVAEVTQSSLGVGYELAYAEVLKKPILCLYRPQPDRRLSAMVDGSPLVEVTEYTSVSELVEPLKTFLESLN